MAVSFDQLLFRGLILFFSVVFGVGILIGIILLIRFLVKLIKRRQMGQKAFCCMTIIYAVVAATSWILNFGWLRVFLTWIAFPVIHIGIFIAINMMTILKTDLSHKIKKIMGLSCASFLGSYLLFPDGGDVGPSYLFFGLIRNDLIANAAWPISILLFVANVVIFILQIIMASKNISDNS